MPRKQMKVRPLGERLLQKRAINERGCWIFTGSTRRGGYGQISEGRRGGKILSAHRAAYELFVGPIPDGMLIDHRCHTPRCFNPDHLRLSDFATNQQNRKGAVYSNPSGIRGVTWDPRNRNWVARAQLNRKNYFLGGYSTKDEAEATVIAWRNQNMPYSIEKRGHSYD